MYLLLNTSYKTEMIRKEGCIQAVKEKYPDLIIDKCTFIDQGQNSYVAVINDEFIFKFPRYKQVIEELKKENIFLQKISSYITLDIPLPYFSSFESNEVGSVFIGYKMIEGVPLEREMLYKLENKHEVAAQISVFLKELHGLSVGSFNDGIVEKRDGHEYWSNMLVKIKENIFPHIREDAKEYISKIFYSFLADRGNFRYEPVIIHGDLGSSNIIFDTEKKRVSGIIDFGQVSVDDPAIDIASLICPMGYGEDFIELILNTYPQAESLIPRARFYVSTFALQEALFGVETGDKEAFYSGIAPYL